MKFELSWQPDPLADFKILFSIVYPSEIECLKNKTNLRLILNSHGAGSSDINFNNMKFPIFYISFGIQKQNDLLEIEFDSQVYINKKAIEYIVQEYNQKLGKKGQLKKITERIIYLSQHKNDPQIHEDPISENTRRKPLGQ